MDNQQEKNIVITQAAQVDSVDGQIIVIDLDESRHVLQPGEHLVVGQQLITPDSGNIEIRLIGGERVSLASISQPLETNNQQAVIEETKDVDQLSEKVAESDVKKTDESVASARTSGFEGQGSQEEAVYIDHVNSQATDVQAAYYGREAADRIDSEQVARDHVEVASAAPTVLGIPSGNNPTPAVVITGVPGSIVHVLINGQPSAITATIGGNGQGSITLPKLPDGSNALTFTQTAPNGLTSAPQTMTVVTDNTVNATDDKATADEDHTGAVTGNVITNDDHGNGETVAATSALTTAHGTYTLNTDGTYTFIVNNAASQSLAVGQSATDTLTYEITDPAGNTTAATLSTTITGTNDKPVLLAHTFNVDEDSSASGQLYMSDIDKTDTLSVTTPVPVLGLTLNADGSYVFDASNRAYQHLGAGQTMDLNIPVIVSDDHGGRSMNQLLIHITGTNDTPVIGGIDHAIGSEKTAVGGHVDVNGALSIVDIDQGESHFQAQLVHGHYGALSISPDGKWHYSADSTQQDLRQLSGSQHVDETFTVKSADGTTHDIHIRIAGEDTPAAFGGVTAGILKEDTIADFSAQMNVSDPDVGEAKFVPVDQATKYGHITLDADGNWHYHLDNTNPDIQKLAESQTITDNVLVGSVDGTPKMLLINIVGTNDSPVVSSAVTLPNGKEDISQTITEAQLLAHATDIDTTDTLHVTNVNVDHGTISMNASGNMQFTPEANYNGKVNFTYDVTDSNGGVVHTSASTDLAAVKDAAVITGTDTGDVLEDHLDPSHPKMLIASGVLHVRDPDAGEDHLHTQTNTAGTYGSFSVSSSGDWTYLVDNALASVQGLKAGETATDAFTVTSVDGTTHTVTVTLTGVNDGPVISAMANQSATEDGAVLTGQFSSSDADIGDTVTYSSAGKLPAGFTLNADGSYALDPSNAAYNHLAQGEPMTLSIPVTVTDSEGATDTTNLTIVVTGTNDIPTLSVTQTTHTTGSLSETDADTTDTHTFSVVNGAGHFGTLTVDPITGAYTYAQNHSVSGMHFDSNTGKYTAQEAFEIKVDDGHGGLVSKFITFNSEATLSSQTTTTGSSQVVAVPNVPPVITPSVPTQPTVSNTAPTLTPPGASTPNTVGIALSSTSDTGSNTSDNITKDNTPEITGWTTVPFSKVEIMDGAKIVATVYSNAHGQFTVSTSSLGDATHTLTAQATEPTASSSVTSSPLDVVIDTQVQAPTIDLETAGTDGVYNAAEVGVDGTITATIKLPSDAKLGDTLTVSGVDHTLSLSDINKGSVDSEIAPGTKITASITDIAGNISVLATETAATADTTPPNAPIIDSIAPHINTPNAPITGTGEVGSTVTITDGSNVLGTAVVGSNGQFSFTPSPALTAGSHTINATQTDPAGNTSGQGNAQTTDVDTSVAQLGIALAHDTGNSATDLITKDGHLTLTHQETGATVEYSTDGGTTWTSSFTPQSGSNTVQVRQTDTAGNVSAPASLTFTLDNAVAAPTVALQTDSGVSSSDKITNDGHLVVTAKEAGATVEYSTDGGQTWLNTFTPKEGVNHAQVRQTDTAGNVSPVTSFDFTYDTTKPIFTINHTLDSNHPDYVISGTASTDTATMTVAIVDVKTHKVIETLHPTIDAHGNWHITSSHLADGAYGLNVYGTDSAGNHISQFRGAIHDTFNIDATVAQLGIALAHDTGNSATDLITKDGHLTLTHQETGATVEYSTDGGATWTSSFTPQSGSNTVQVRQTDSAGNVSTPTSLSFTLDNTVATPTLSLLKDSGVVTTDNITNKGGLTVGNTETGAKVEYSGDNGKTWDILQPSPHEGSNAVLVRQTDTAGNVSASSTIHFILDTSATAVDDTASATEDQNATATTGNVLTNDEAGSTVKVGDIAGKYGTYHMQANGDYTYELDNTNSAVQALAKVATLPDPVQYEVTDKAGNVEHATLITTITGTNDAPTLTTALVNQAVEAEDNLHFVVPADTFTDVDSGDTLTYTATQKDGSALPSWLHFDASTQTFNGTPPAGSSGTVETRVVATDLQGETAHSDFDIAVTALSGSTGDVNEDGTTATISGLIHSAAHTFTNSQADGTYGHLEMRNDGRWIYTLNNAAANVQGLKGGEVVHDILPITLADGTVRHIDVTVTGTHDLPTLSLPTATHDVISAVEQHSVDASMDISHFHSQQQGVAVGHRIMHMYAPGSDVDLLANIPVSDRPTISQAYTHFGTETGYSYLQDMWFANHIASSGMDFSPQAPSMRNAMDGGIYVFDDGSVGLAHKACDGNSANPKSYIYYQLVDHVNANDGFSLIRGQAVAGVHVEIFDGTTSLGTVTANAQGEFALPIFSKQSDGTHHYHTVINGVSSPAQEFEIAGDHVDAVAGGIGAGSVTEDGTIDHISGSIHISDADINDHPVITAQSDTAGTYGKFSIDAQGNWHYELDDTKAETNNLTSGQHVTESFHVITTTDSGERVDTVFSVAVNGHSDVPTIGNISQKTVAEGDSLFSSSVEGHDHSGHTDSTLVYSTHTTAAGFTFNADGTYSIDPSNAAYNHLKAGEHASIDVPVTVTDVTGATTVSHLNIVINGTNDVPVVSSSVTDTVAEDADSHHTLDLLNGATDPDGDTLSVTGVTNLPAGVTLAADGHTLVVDSTNAAFQHLAAGATQDIVVNYQVTDGHGGSVAQSATVSVTGTNDAPTVTTATTPVDLGAIDEDTTKSYTEAELLKLTGASDVDGDTLSVSGVSVDPAQGTFAKQSDGTWLFTPVHNLSADNIALTVSISDGTATTNASATIDVTGVADTPTLTLGVHGVITTTLNSADFSSQSGAIDIDITDSGSYQSPSQGVSSGYYDVSSAKGGSGDDIFRFSNLEAGKSYTVDGGAGNNILDLTGFRSSDVSIDSKTGVVTVNLPNNAGQATIHYSHISDLQFSGDVFDGTPHGLEVVGGNWVLEGTHLSVEGRVGNQLAIVKYAGEIQSSFTLDAKVNVHSAPGCNATGGILFDYVDARNYKVAVLRAGQGGWNIEQMKSGVLSVVARVSDPALAKIETDQQVELRVHDSVAELWAAGVMKVSHDFHEPLNDGEFGVASQGGKVDFTLEMKPTDWAPYAPDVNAQMNVSDGQTSLADLLTATKDHEGHAVTMTHFDATTAHGGTVVHNADGTYTYTPASGFVGSDTFTYVVSDGVNQTTASVKVNVADLNTVSNTHPGDAFDLDVTAALTDASELLGVRLLGLPAGTIISDGTTTLAAVGNALTPVDISHLNLHSLHIQPPAGHAGSYIFHVETQSTDGASTSAWVSKEVRVQMGSGSTYVDAVATHDNSLQETGDRDLGATNEDTAKHFTEAQLLEHLSDADGALHVSGMPTSTHGTITGDAANGYTFTPSANYHGNDLDISYKVSDGSTEYAKTAQLDVTAVADTPSLSISLGAIAMTNHSSSPTQIVDTVDATKGADNLHKNPNLHTDFGVSKYALSSPDGLDPALITGLMIDGKDAGAPQIIDSFMGKAVIFPGLDIDTIRSGHTFTLSFASAAPKQMDWKFICGVHDQFNDSNADYLSQAYGLDIHVNREVSGGPAQVYQSADITEDTDIPLVITTSSPDASESLSIKVTGVPSGATLSAGTNNHDGSWTLTPAQLSNLHMTPPADFSGEIRLGVTSTTTDGTDHASATADLRLNVAAVAETPTLTGADVSIDEDSGSAALGVNLNLHVDPSETLSILIEGVPAGATLSAGTKNADGSWSLTAAQLQGLSVSPESQYSGTMALRVTATSTEQTGEHASTVLNMNVHVNAVMDMVAVTHDVHVNPTDMGAGIAIPLDISSVDTSESYTFTIDIPHGWHVSYPDGSIGTSSSSFVGNAQMLSGMKIFAPAGYIGDQAIDIHVTGTDAGITKDFNLTTHVSVVNTVPLISAALTDTVAEDADAHHTLDLLNGATDADGDALSVTGVTNLPAGVTLAADGHTLVVDSTNAAFQHLAAGATQDIVVNYQVTDGHGGSVAQSATVTITGTNDVPTVTEQNTNIKTVIEDGGHDHIRASGQILINDVDSGDTHTITTQSDHLGSYGHFSVAADGGWHYVLDNTLPATQALSEGQHVKEHFDVQMTDNNGVQTVHKMTFDVQGTNDAPVVAQALTSQSVDEGNALNFALPQGTFTDVDNGNTLTLTATKADGSALPAWLHFDPTTQTFSGTPAHADDGQVSVKVTATDASHTSVSTNFALNVVDNVVPNAPVIDPIAPHINTPNAPITGTGEVGSTVTITDGGNVLGTAVVGTNGHFAFTPTTPLTAGSHTINATQTDPAGNTSGQGSAQTTDVDTTTSTPTSDLTDATDTGFSQTDNITKTHNPVIIGSAEPGSTVVITDASGTQVGTATADPQGHYNVTTSNLTEGDHTLTITSTDAAGNSASVNQDVHVDTTVPTFTMVQADSVNTPIFHITGTVDSDAHSVEVEITTISRPATHIETLHAVLDGHGGWSIDTSSLPDGGYNATPKVVDAAGNVSTSRLHDFFHIDTQIQALTLSLTHDTGSSSTDNITTDGQLSIGNREGSTATISYSIDGGHTWTSSFTPVDGQQTLQVRQTDGAGNVSMPTSLTFTLDNSATAPVVELVKDTGPYHTTDTQLLSDKITSNAQLHITQEPGASVEYSVDGGQTWTPTFTPPAHDGQVGVDVRQTDIAGNVSPVTHFDFTYDTTKPVFTVQNTPDSNHPVYTVSGSVDAQVTDIRVDITEVGSRSATQTLHPTLDANGNWHITTQSLPDGDYQVDVAGTDLAGNSSHIGHGTLLSHFTIDSTAHATDDTASITEDATAAVSGNVLSNDEQGSTVTTTGDIAGQYGTYHLSADGTYTYTLDNSKPEVQAFAEGSHHDDPISYSIQDAAGNTATARLTTTITGTNDAPVLSTPGATAGADGWIHEDGTGAFANSASIRFSATDPDTGDTLTYKIDPNSLPQHGSVTHIDGGRIVYQLDNNDHEVDKLNDGQQLVDSFKVLVTDSHGVTTEKLIHMGIHGHTDGAPSVQGTSGNPASLQQGVTLELDHLTDSGTSDSDGITNNTAPILWGQTDIGGSTVKIFDGSKLVATVVSDANGDYNAVLSGQSEGAHHYVAQATAPGTFGHLSSTPVDVVVDTQNDARVNTFGVDMHDKQEVETQIFLEKDATVTKLQIVDEQGNHIDVPSSNQLGGYSHSNRSPGHGYVHFTGIDVSSLADGKLHVVAEVTDSAGNVKSINSPTGQSFDKDTTATVSDDTKDINEGSALGVGGNVLTNDADASQVTSTGTIKGQYGTFHLFHDGIYTYELYSASDSAHKAGYDAVQALAPSSIPLVDTIPYTVNDGHGNTATAHLSINVHGAIDAPTLTASADVQFTPTYATGYIDETGPHADHITLHTFSENRFKSSDTLDFTDADSSSKVNMNLAEAKIGVDSLGGVDSDGRALSDREHSASAIEASEALVVELEGSALSARIGLGGFNLGFVSNDKLHYVLYDAAHHKVGDGYLSPEDIDADALAHGTNLRSSTGLAEFAINSNQPFSFIAIEAVLGSKTSGHTRFSITHLDAPLIQYTTELHLQGTLSDAGNHEQLTYRITGLDASSKLDHGSRQQDGSWLVTQNELADLHLLHTGKLILQVEAIATDGSHSAHSAMQTLDIDPASMHYEMIAGETEGKISEDNKTAISGDLEIESNQTGLLFVAQSHVVGKYGEFSLDEHGHWTYHVNSAKSDPLSAGEKVTDTLTVVTSDGVSTKLVVNIDGKDDATVLGGKLTGDVKEDASGQMEATGQLNYSDVDTDISTIGMYGMDYTGKYGTLHINADGSWKYTLDNSKPATQVLNGGEIEHEVFDQLHLTSNGRFSAATPIGQIDIAVHGTNDPNAIIGDAVAGGSVTEDTAQSTTGKLSITDVNTGEDHFNPIPAGTAGASGYGWFGVKADGTWEYHLYNKHDIVQNLNSSDHVTDSIVVHSADGTTHTISVNVHGADEGSTRILDHTIQRVIIPEITSVSHTFDHSSGQIHTSDHSLQYSVTHTGDHQYGTLSVSPDGSFHYTPDSNMNTAGMTADGGHGGKHHFGGKHTGTDVFEVEVSNGHGGTVTKELSFDLETDYNGHKAKVTSAHDADAAQVHHDTPDISDAVDDVSVHMDNPFDLSHAGDLVADAKTGKALADTADALEKVAGLLEQHPNSVEVGLMHHVENAPVKEPVPSEHAIQKAEDTKDDIPEHTATDEHHVDHADYTPSDHPIDDDDQHHDGTGLT